MPDQHLRPAAKALPRGESHASIPSRVRPALLGRDTIDVLPENRHPPALAEERLDEPDHREKQRTEVDDDLEHDHDEEPEKRKTSEGAVDEDDNDETETLREKEEEPLAGVKTDEIAVPALVLLCHKQHIL